MRTNGLPAVSSAGKVMTLSSTMTSGRTRSMIAFSWGSQYLAPSISASQIGLVTVSSCSRVDLRYSGAVSRMKSFQNCPASCSSFGRRREVDQVLLESQGLQFALPGGLSGENDAVSALTKNVTDADAVVRRPVGTLRHEQDRERHHASLRLGVGF